MEAICDFYCDHFRTDPAAEVKLFRHVLEKYPERFSRKIAKSFTDAPVDFVRTEFVESRLNEEKSGTVLECYHYYIKRARELTSKDISWIRRWIDSGARVYGLLAAMESSSIPIDAQADLIAEMEAKGVDYVSTAKSVLDATPNLTKLAQQLLADSRFAGFNESGRRWLKLVAEGQGPSVALRMMRKETYRRLQDEHT